MGQAVIDNYMGSNATLVEDSQAPKIVVNEEPSSLPVQDDDDAASGLMNHGNNNEDSHRNAG